MQICPDYTMEKLTKAIGAFQNAQTAEKHNFPKDKLAYLIESKSQLQRGASQIEQEIKHTKEQD